jgi:glycosyltransferase involved in cell wall biosynthesis
LKHIKPDALIPFLWYPILLSNPATWLSNIPVIGCERTNPEKNFQPGLRGWVWNIMLSIAYRKIRHITTNSHALKDMLILKYPHACTKTSVIQNSFDAALLDSMSDQENPFADRPEVKHLLAVGRLTEAKNYPLLIDAFLETKSLNTTILHIIGDGEDREKIAHLIHTYDLGNRVILHGFQTNPYPFLRFADAFILSSAWEGFPNSLMEALYLNGHVISTNCPTGPSEIITHMKDGILIDNMAKEQMTEAIDLILSDENLRELLHTNSRLSAGRFSLDTMVNGFEHLISKIIQASHA